MQKANQRFDSIISRNVTIDGEIRGKENLAIEGRVKGVVILEGDLFVAETGVVEAEIEADDVVILGKVNGNIKARKQLELRPSGKLFGEIHATSIDIREGAVFEGRSHMIPKRTTPVTSPPPKKTIAPETKPGVTQSERKEAQL